MHSTSEPSYPSSSLTWGPSVIWSLILLNTRMCAGDFGQTLNVRMGVASPEVMTFRKEKDEVTEARNTERRKQNKNRAFAA